MFGKSFGQRLVDSTCLFCGAPLTNKDHCNYCGSYYVNYNKFQKEINIPDVVEILPLSITVNNFYNEEKPNLMFYNINDVSVTCEESYYELFKTLMSLAIDSVGTDSKFKKDIILNYRAKEGITIKEYKILLKSAFIIKLSKNYNADKSVVEAYFVYDQIFILNGRM